MRSQKTMEQLISVRWPKLRKRAQNERNPENVIKILEEIDDLLFNLEMGIVCQHGTTYTKDGTDTGLVCGTSKNVQRSELKIESE